MLNVLEVLFISYLMKNIGMIIHYAPSKAIENSNGFEESNVFYVNKMVKSFLKVAHKDLNNSLRLSSKDISQHICLQFLILERVKVKCKI